MRFLVVGDANADLAASLDRFPHEGDDAPVRDLAWGSGGSGANVAAALARLGAPARFFGRVGRDPAAAVALAAVGAAGVDLDLVQRDAALPTGLCFAAVSPGGERTFFSSRGANAALAPPSGDAFDGIGWLHVAGHALLEGPQRETTEALIAEGVRRAVPCSIDLCLPLVRADRAAIFDLAPRAAVVFANRAELAALAGSVDEALALLLARGAPLVAAKLGARGSRLAGREHLEAAPFAVDAVDTTAAGDAYVAGFLAAQARGAPLAGCARVANAAGALTASRLGAADALPTFAELCDFLAAHGALADLAALQGAS